MAAVVKDRHSEIENGAPSGVRAGAEARSLAASLGQRYGSGAVAPCDDGASEALHAAVAARAGHSVDGLLQHRSVRAFTSAPLPSGTLELLVGAAQSAASSSNLQLWSVVAVSDPARRRALAEVAGQQAHILHCPLFLVWLADLHRPTELARERAIPSAGLDFLEMFLMASIDAALAAQNAVVAAEALGLGGVYIGALRNDPLRVAEILGLPPRTFAVFGLCLGYPDPARAGAVKPRLPQSVVVHADSYDASASARQAVVAYDERMSRFYAEQHMEVPSGGWSVHSAQRIASAAALRGRDRLRQALSHLGFELR